VSFRLVLKSVTLNDFERRNGRYIALFRWIWLTCVPTHNRFRAQEREFTFAISSPDELLVNITYQSISHLISGRYTAWHVYSHNPRGYNKARRHALTIVPKFISSLFFLWKLKWMASRILCSRILTNYYVH